MTSAWTPAGVLDSAGPIPGYFDSPSGRELGRAVTESRVANGMFLSPGWGRDVIYCSTGTVARVWAED